MRSTCEWLYCSSAVFVERIHFGSRRVRITDLPFRRRYHSSKALLMLERYIIGRVVEPWVNVRSRTPLSKTDDGSTIGGQDGPKTASNRAGLQLRSGRDPATNHQRLRQAQLAADAEEQEQRTWLRRSPSLDAKTQQAIARDYRALHEQIQAAALYQCRYSEYAVEAVRCGLLFGGFVYLLRCEWYVASSLFLGMFWVGTHRASRSGS